MLQIFFAVLLTLLLSGCATKAPRKNDDFEESDNSVTICCPGQNGFACDWMTVAEDGKEKVELAKISKTTGIMTAVCPLDGSSS